VKFKTKRVPKETSQLKQGSRLLLMMGQWIKVKNNRLSKLEKYMLKALTVKTRKNSCKIFSTSWTSRVSVKKGDLKLNKTN